MSTNQKQYLCSEPGTFLFIEDEKVRKRHKSTKGKNNIKFPGSTRMYTTDDPLIQDYIEKHRLFKKGVITRVPSADEIKKIKLKKKQEANLLQFRDLYSRGLLKTSQFAQQTRAEIEDIANKIGAKVEKTREKTIDSVYSLISQEEDDQ